MNVPVLAKWHEIAKRHDPSELESLLADNVVYFSPIIGEPQEGKKLANVYLSAAVKVFYTDTYRYVRQVVGDKTAVLEFVNTVYGVAVNGVDMITWDDADKIVEFKIMLRPLNAINLIHEKMGQVLAGHKPVSNLAKRAK